MSTQKSRLTDEVDRLDENVNGLFAQLSELKDRVEELVGAGERNLDRDDLGKRLVGEGS